MLKSDVNLFNHLVRKADVAGCCSAVLFFVITGEVAPYSVSLICIVPEVVFNAVDADQLIRYCVIIDYLTWFDGLHARCDM